MPILCEPGTALGPSEATVAHDLIQRLSAEGVGILLVIYDKSDVFALLSRLMVIKTAAWSA